jgi:adenine-specific DNA-methyltransferase
MITDFHPKLFAHELRRRRSAANSETLAGAIQGAEIDLNPHQVEAALFAGESKLSRGVKLDDEVGLGKTKLDSQNDVLWADTRRGNEA